MIWHSFKVLGLLDCQNCFLLLFSSCELLGPWPLPGILVSCPPQACYFIRVCPNSTWPEASCPWHSPRSWLYPLCTHPSKAWHTGVSTEGNSNSKAQLSSQAHGRLSTLTNSNSSINKPRWSRWDKSIPSWPWGWPVQERNKPQWLSFLFMQILKIILYLLL